MVPEMEEIGIRITVIFFRGQAGSEFQANTIDSIELIEKGGMACLRLLLRRSRLWHRSTLKP